VSGHKRFRANLHRLKQSALRSSLLERFGFEIRRILSSPSPCLCVFAFDAFLLSARPSAAQSRLRETRGEIAGERSSLRALQKNGAQTRRRARRERGALRRDPQAIAQLAPHQVVRSGKRTEEHAEPNGFFAIPHVFFAQELFQPRGVSRRIAPQ
jgi:hypothetical protein